MSIRDRIAAMFRRQSPPPDDEPDRVVETQADPRLRVAAEAARLKARRAKVQHARIEQEQLQATLDRLQTYVDFEDWVARNE